MGLSSETPTSLQAAMRGRLEASIMAESCLVDRETGRIYWEGGSSSTLGASVFPKIQDVGLVHVKATVLALLLVFALLGFLAAFLRQRLQEPTLKSKVDNLPWHLSIPLFVLKCTLLQVPRPRERDVAIIVIFYFLEAYFCSTRYYLSHALYDLGAIEEYIEKLRNEAPVVTWKVRGFHYERPWWLAPWQLIFARKEEKHIGSDSWFKSKRITHVATATYKYKRFIDDTIAGVWKRAAMASTIFPPCYKVTLSKILILSDGKARENFFKQQRSFVQSEGEKDDFAEFSTNFDVPGFKPKMLVVPPSGSGQSRKGFRTFHFWFFTLLGLSLPYRMWFYNQCDQLRVSVVKETSADILRNNTSAFRWFSTRKPAAALTDTGDETFRELMQALALYNKEDDAILEQAIQPINTIDLPERGAAEGAVDTVAEGGESIE